MANPLVSGRSNIMPNPDQSVLIELQETRDQLQLVLETMSDGLVTFNEAQEVVSMNHAAATIFGLKTAGVAGLVAADILGDMLTLRDQYLDPTETRVLRADGTPVPVELSVRVLMTASGRLFVVTIRDITERKYAEQIQADFISMVSHDLRSPLTVIMGAFEALAMNPEQRSPEVIDMMVEMGYRNCGRLQRLIEDLLDINQLEGDTISLDTRTLCLSEVLEQSITDVGEVSRRLGVRVEIQSCPADAVVTADPLRVNQVMNNLLTNAVKFSDEGSCVQVSAIVSGESVVVSVTDHGRGIPADFRPMIFRQFSRDPGVAADGTDGFGLGLSICKRLLERMHGAIDYESELGVGSRFFFSLPGAATGVELASAGGEAAVLAGKE
ncbi:MAG: HAMP domain-containing sensor histidine kinase [Burkholderiaceae bacterium]